MTKQISLRAAILTTLFVLGVAFIIISGQMASARINNPGSSSSGGGSSSGYPFAVTGNATTTLTQFNGGLTAYASSTISDLHIINSLTTGGGSTLWTTGPNSSYSNAYTITSAGMTYSAVTVGTTGNFGIGSTTPNALLSMMDTSGFASVATHPTFQIGSSTRGVSTSTLLYMDNRGFIGLGTTNPQFILDVFKPDTQGIRIVETSPLGSAGGGGITLHTSVIPTAVGDRLGFAAIGYNDIAGVVNTNSLGIFGYACQPWTVSSAQGSYLTFETTPNDSATRAVAMTINCNQFVGIGTTTPVANLQVTSPSANATTSLQFGKPGQNKGTCITYYDDGGTPVYGHIAIGATSFTYTSTKPSGCQN